MKSIVGGRTGMLLLAVAWSGCGGHGSWTPPPPTPIALPPASDASAQPQRPYATAELTSPDEQTVVGVSLTVLGEPPDAPGGLEPSFPSLEGPLDLAGVVVSARLYPPLAYELEHGSLDGYAPGPPAGEPEPSFTFTARAARQPTELLVFGDDAAWQETVPLQPCAADPCATYVSPAGALVVAVPHGTAARLGIGAGWTIAVSP
jgi:hypothetical protein